MLDEDEELSRAGGAGLMPSSRALWRYDAFVSYFDEEAGAWSRKFIENLEAIGVKVWHRGCVSYGQDSDEEAAKAIVESAAFLQIVSPGVFRSREVQVDVEKVVGSILRGEPSHMPRPTAKVVRVCISIYECPDERVAPGNRAVRLLAYQPAQYQEQVVRLAREITGRSIGKPDWGQSDVPLVFPAAVDEPIWKIALHIAEFIASFSALWQEYESFHAPRQQTHDLGRQRARRAAYEYLYDHRCHTSIELLVRALAKFQPQLEAATRLVNYGQSARAWWSDAYARVELAAKTVERNEEAAEEATRQRRVEEHEARETEARVKQEQHEQALREQENLTVGKAYSETIKDTTRMSTPSPKHIDFLIINAREEERLAVLSKLPGYRKLDRDGADTHTYYEAEVKTRRQDGAVYHVVVSSLTGMGPIMGALKASAVTRRWSPEHVMVVGIAGGVEGEVALGDVMVASQVPDYTVGKIHETGRREERWVSYPADANLLDAADNFPSGWDDLITEQRPCPGTPKRNVGVIVSGGDVIASKEQIAIYFADWPKLIGVEMEGGGVAAGLHSDIERPRFLMIRGVSDLANGQNNAEMKRAWRAYACDVAAAYAIGLLRDGLVPGARVPLPIAPVPASIKASVNAHEFVPAAPLLSPTQGDTQPPVTVGHDLAEIAGLLKRLEDSQFGDVVLRLRIEDAILPAQSAPLATRAQALVRRMDQEGAEGVRRLVTAIQSVAPHLPWRPAARITAAAGAAPAPTSVPVASMTSAAVLAATTPTWAEFDSLPRRYEVNPFDDIVLCMHPDCEREWRTIVPNARMGVQCVTIRTPAGPWHRAGAPTLSIWKDVFEQINAKVQEVRAAKQSRLHLVAKAPFSLGALLGRFIDPQDQLLVYQPENNHGSKVWRPWGPAWPADPGTRETPFFDVPAGLEQCRPEQDGHFALVVDVSGNSNADSCVEAAKAWAGGRNVQPLLIRANDITGQDTVRVPADVDKAAIELDRIFQQIAEALPNATLHVFYYGPLGILIRACRRLWLRRTTIIFWDTYYDPAARWFPAIAFPEGRLLIGDGAP